MTGKFITVEGTEGVGKSTNIELIRNYIESRGVELVVTREPGGTPLAEEMRELLLEKRDEPFAATAELLIMFAARAQHIDQLIAPALARGAWVLSDRFTDATFAYQGYGRKLPLEDILKLEQLVQKGLQPDHTFFLDIDVRKGLARAKARADLDRFESEEIEFFEDVRRGYHERISQNPERYIVIDAGQSLTQVQADIEKSLEAIL